MSKGKKTLFNALTSIVYTLIYGLLSLVVIRLVILEYGSDFNGLNSTANQLVGILLLLEGGFTLAINVSLFKPIVEKDFLGINKILSAATIVFRRVGLGVLIIGILTSVGYSFIIKSNLPREIPLLIFLMTVFPTAFNLGYATKYSILLQSEQREYILNTIKILSVVIAQVSIIIVIFLEGHMLLVRMATMIGAFISSFFTVAICKKLHRNLDFTVEPDFKATKGTKDILIQKITGIIYSTAPILFISATIGTKHASIFAVYSGVFLLLKNIIGGFTTAPRMGFGQLITESKLDYVKEVYSQYEFIVFIVMFCILSVTTVLIMPFISLYTIGFTDINYTNWIIAAFFIGITFFEIIHLPSGNIINMSGRFHISRDFQVIAVVILVIALVIGSLFFGFKGILSAVFLTAVLLAILEIRYVHKEYFNGSIFNPVKCLITNLIFIGVFVFLEVKFLPVINGFVKFIGVGVILLVINFGLIMSFNYLLNKKIVTSIIFRFSPTKAGNMGHKKISSA